jgi:hypothetical protein
LKKEVSRNLKFALTGNTSDVRPLLSLLLQKRGFSITTYPAKGIKGLICGDAHVSNKVLESHRKYKQALKNQVPIIKMLDLPQELGLTLKDILKEITLL